MAEFPDRLELMLKKQRNIQEDVYDHNFQKMTPAERSAYIKEMVLAAVHELHEALDETGWKSWSKADHFFPDLYTAELVDVWLMLMNLFLATGMNPDEIACLISDRTRLKQSLNIQRQENGY